MHALDEIDEALSHAALAQARGPAWQRFVDSLLDERLAVEPHRSPRSAEPAGSDRKVPCPHPGCPGPF